MSRYEANSNNNLKSLLWTIPSVIIFSPSQKQLSKFGLIFNSPILTETFSKLFDSEFQLTKE